MPPDLPGAAVRPVRRVQRRHGDRRSEHGARGRRLRGGGLTGIGSGSEEVLELIRVLAVVHFANFLAGFATLGLGAAAFAYALAWPTAFLPRWLGWLGLLAGALLLFTPLAVTAEVLFLPFFLGAILTLIWLVAAGLWLALQRPGPRGAGGSARTVA